MMKISNVSNYGPLSGGNDSRKRQERPSHSQTRNSSLWAQRMFFFCFFFFVFFIKPPYKFFFCLAWVDRNINLYTVFPWFCFHFHRMQISTPLGSLAVSLLPVYWSLLKITSDLLVVARSLMFVFISHISLVNFCHMTPFSIKPSPAAIHLELASLSDEGP